MTRPQLLRPAGFYGYLVVGAIYISEAVLDRETLIKALKCCIDEHTVLGAGIRDADSEAPEFVRPPTVNVQDHFRFLEAPSQLDSSEDSQLKALKQVLRHLYAQRSDDIEISPPWSVAVMPLAPSTSTLQSSIVGFGFSHSHGDGSSGLAFHRSFVKALNAVAAGRCVYTGEPEHTTSTAPLPPPLERAGTLSISWSFLLGPLIAEYAPASLARWLGLDASTGTNTWRAHPAFCDPGSSATNVEILQIPQPLMQRVLAACRAHQTTFTGLLHSLIVRALNEALPAETSASGFMAQTAIDLRRHLTGTTRDDMGVFASGASAVLARPSTSDFTRVWSEAREMSQLLVKSAESLKDQPVGLLAYLSKIRPWLMGKIGKPRGGSYEVSNLMVFDDEQPEAAIWRIGDVFFSQPFDAVDCALSFNVLARKGGDLILTMSWQVGVLMIEDETKFGEAVCQGLAQLLEKSAST